MGVCTANRGRRPYLGIGPWGAVFPGRPVRGKTRGRIMTWEVTGGEEGPRKRAASVTP